jgi:hypothetical protein
MERARREYAARETRYRLKREKESEKMEKHQRVMRGAGRPPPKVVSPIKEITKPSTPSAASEHSSEKERQEMLANLAIKVNIKKNKSPLRQKSSSKLAVKSK